MGQMQAEYLGNFRTKAQHLDSKATLITDAPKDNQGLGEAFSPTDLLCTSLASCMLTIMGIKAKSLGIEMAGVNIDIEKKMAQAPRRVEEIVLSFHWNGVDKKIQPEHLESLKRAGLACPVALSLDPNIKKTINW